MFPLQSTTKPTKKASLTTTTPDYDDYATDHLEGSSTPSKTTSSTSSSTRSSTTSSTRSSTSSSDTVAAFLTKALTLPTTCDATQTRLL